MVRYENRLVMTYFSFLILFKCKGANTLMSSFEWKHQVLAGELKRALLGDPNVYS